MKLRPKHKKKKKPRKSKIGLPPGTLVYTGEQVADSVTLEYVIYNEDSLVQKKAEKIEDIPITPDSITWLNVAGLHDVELLKIIGEKLHVPYLQLEDILNINQRAKVESHPDWASLILKMVTHKEQEKALDIEHLAIFCRENLVITFQEKTGDVFNPVRQRLEREQSRLRNGGSDYLLYALFDVVVDHYLMVLEGVTDAINDLDDRIRLQTDKTQMAEIQELKAQLMSFRKAVWPLRFAVRTLVNETTHIIEESTRPFLKDIEDHIHQVVDGIESEREMFDTLMDTYISMVSFRMNEIMKVLTIIATIFIPLTFLAGIYGMNFEYLPELGWRYSYFVFWGISLFTVIGMVFFFRRKGWL